MIRHKMGGVASKNIKFDPFSKWSEKVSPQITTNNFYNRLDGGIAYYLYLNPLNIISWCSGIFEHRVQNFVTGSLEVQASEQEKKKKA